MRYMTATVGALVLMVLVYDTCRADAPRMIPFMGKLTDATGIPLPDGAKTVTFRLHSGAAGTFAVTDELHTFNGSSFALNFKPVVANSEVISKADGTVTYARDLAYSIDYQTGVITRVSSAAIPNGTQVKVSYQHTTQLFWEEQKQVTVVGGFFTTSLGDTNLFPASFAFDRPLFLGIQVEGDPEMAPRIPLGSVPHALSIADNSVTPAKLTNDPRSLEKVSGGALGAQAGRVGIGTGDPSAELDITGGAGGVIPPRVTLRMAPGDQSPMLFTQELGGLFTISNGGLPRMSLTPGGQTGIGTLAPQAPLHIVGPEGDGTTAPLKITSGSQSMLIEGNEIDVEVSPLMLLNNTAANLSLVNGGGNVGIGTTAPITKLDIRDSQAIVRLTSSNTSGLGSMLQFRNAGAGQGANAFIDFLDPAGATRGRIAFDAAENLTFRSGGNDQMRLSAAGKLGVGGTDTRALLTLRGPDDVNDGPQILLFGNASDQAESGRIRFVEGTALANWRGAYMHFNGAANRLHLGVHATSDALPANDVNAISITRSATPLVGIGTENPAAELDVNGDIRANGTVTKTYGTSTYFNFAPIAMAHIESNGTITTGTPNVSCFYVSSTKTYRITIAGENFSTQAGRYVTLVVPGNVGNVSIPHIGASSGDWSVTMQDGLGNPHANRFSFVVYKP